MTCEHCHQRIDRPEDGVAMSIAGEMISRVCVVHGKCRQAYQKEHAGPWDVDDIVSIPPCTLWFPVLSGVVHTVDG